VAEQTGDIVAAKVYLGRRRWGQGLHGFGH
jgi:hypothetical protein